MARDHLQPDYDWLIAARLYGAAKRRVRSGGLPEADKVAGAAELRELAEGRGDHYRVQAQAVAELCRMAGADETLIPEWTAIGRERAEQARWPPFSWPGHTPGSR